MEEIIPTDVILSFEPGLGVKQLRAQDEFAPGSLILVKRELFLPLLSKLRNVEASTAGEHREGKIYVINAMINLFNGIRQEELEAASEEEIRAELKRRGDLLLERLLTEMRLLPPERTEYAGGMKSAIDLFIGRLSVLVLLGQP